ADEAAFSPDGRWLLTATRAVAFFPGQNSRGERRGGGIALRDPRTLKPLRTYPGSPVAGALSHDGHTFAEADADGSVRFLDLRTGVPHPASGRHDALIRDAAFTPDDRFLVTGGEDAKAIVWDVARATAAETFDAQSKRIIGVAVDARGRTAYTAGED